MLHSDFANSLHNPTSDSDKDALLRGTTSSENYNGSNVLTFGVREDSEYGSVWPQLDENLTPEEALKSIFFKVNWTISTIMPFIINLAIGFGLNHSYSYMGLTTESDSHFDSPNSSAFLDMGITSFCVVFLTSLFAKGAVQKGVANAKVGPINDLELTTKPWKFFPLRVRNHCGRSFLLAIQIISVWTSVSFLILYAICAGGGMVGDDNTVSRCFITMTPYLIMKSTWAGVLACLVYPLCFLPALNRAGLTAKQYQEYLKKREDILSENGQLPPEWPSVSIPPPNISTSTSYHSYQAVGTGVPTSDWAYVPPSQIKKSPS